MVPILHRDYAQVGGFRSLPTRQDMYDIPLDRRKIGMLVYIVADDELNILKGGISNNNFQPTSLGGGGGGSSVNLDGYLKSDAADGKYASKSEVYTKAEVDEAIRVAVEAAVAGLYTKEEVDQAIEDAITAL